MEQDKAIAFVKEVNRIYNRDDNPIYQPAPDDLDEDLRVIFLNEGIVKVFPRDVTVYIYAPALKLIVKETDLGIRE